MRKVILSYGSWITAALLVIGLAGIGGDADAKDKKKPKGKPAAAKKKDPPKADHKAVTELMGEFKWGMSPDEVMAIIGTGIDEQYAEKIKGTTDIQAQNKLRKQAVADKKRIKDTYVEFKDKASSWDVSILEREFDHMNDEAMLSVWENDKETGTNQHRFYFFVDGKLWKMFIQLNYDMFEGKTFADFQTVMEKRYGPGAIEMRKESDGTETFDFIYWRGGGVLLRAIDLTKSYDTFCIAISDETVESFIATRRQERNPKKNRDNEDNANVVDKVSGDDGKK